MFSKAKKTETIDREQREQYEYARIRIKQKKSLLRHFIIFLIGAVFLVVLNGFMDLGNDFLIEDWYVWAIIIWSFLLLIHVFNVFVMNTFMGKEWEDAQLTKLKLKQEERIAELKKQALQEVTVSEVKIARESEAMLKSSTEASSLKKNTNPNLLPPEDK